MQYRSQQINSRFFSYLGVDAVLFAFEDNESISSESAGAPKLLYVFEGQLEVAVDGKKLALNEGDSVVISAQKKHALQAVGRCKFVQIG
ncbi:hypothetical protein HMSSN036_90560 [Paenibacillus macerans]|nr:hypothetical protein HMSSN036_90560 [Paenibacillus macerans]